MGVAYSRPTLWRLEREGKFPKRVKLGTSGRRGGRVSWLYGEIVDHVSELAAARNQSA